MLLPSDMAGYQATCPPPVTVANITEWNMHFHVPKVAYLPSDITATLLIEVCHDV